MQALRANQTSMFQVSGPFSRLACLKIAQQVSRWWEDWTFNPKTKSWHFDIASASIGEWEGDVISFGPMPLPQGSQPQLIADDITTYFEKTFGDVLYLYASSGSTYIDDLSDYATRGVLTFGAVVKWGEEIVAHFPSNPSPELYFEDQSHNITAIYSTEGMFYLWPSVRFLIKLVSSRVDMQIHNIHTARLNLYFSLRLPLKERYRVRAAYLSQHPSDADTHTRKPAYLFVPPLQFECINGMHCIRYPLPELPFYWASDPKGRHVIPKNNWVRYGIPELDVQTWTGSYWGDNEYEAVKQHLVRKKYGSNSKQYALDHGYPELICGVY
ncbi:hypothetical protein PQX77_013393 [Marasmius sp. AFHP31]|nr:hypothetical protein PQX77_013393 [Marasmius sp. AFHP31]